jgi:hypothetical protein
MTPDDIELIQTWRSCPEQYDAYHQGTCIGYLNLRGGMFTVVVEGTRVYLAEPRGDGEFEPEERERYLLEAKQALVRFHTLGEKTPFVPTPPVQVAVQQLAKTEAPLLKESMRRTKQITQRCKELTRITRVAQVPYDAPMIYACAMLGATIARAIKLSKDDFMRWCSDSWDAAERHQED